MTTGFQQGAMGLTIEKDVEAQLVYALDWAEWLQQGDALDTVDFTVNARVNDPAPVIKVASGIQGTKTFIEVNGGQAGKTYIATAKVTTSNGLVDRRSFRIKCENRTA